MNSYGTQLVFDLEDISSVAVARRAGMVLARELDFDEVRTGQLALLITEAATNIVKHAGFGQILLRTLGEGIHAGIEVIALDKGPGIDDLGWYVEDGNSTTGTYGIGLGAVRRLSQDFDLYSVSGKGTVLWMVIWASEQAPSPAAWQVGAICVPIKGEEVSGDSWAMAAHEKCLTLIVADGLGHGPEAALAANAAVNLPDIAEQSPAIIVQRAHTALQGTRGAAVAVSYINKKAGTLGFAGVGNIAVCLLRNQGNRHLISHNGIVGANLRKLQEFSEDWDSDAMLVAHSDGISTRWDISSYPDLIFCHPAVIAAVIYRDFARGKDDSTIVVVRESFE